MDFFKVISPLIFLGHIFGNFPFIIKNHKMRISFIYSAYTLLIISFVNYNFISTILFSNYFSNFSQYNRSSITKYFQIFQIAFFYLNYNYSQLLPILKKNKIIIILNKMREFSNQFQTLNRKHFIFVLFFELFTFTFHILFFYDCFLPDINQKINLMFFFVTILSLSTNYQFSLRFGDMIMFLGLNFRHINENLSKFYFLHDFKKANFFNKKHFLLCKLSLETNTLFSKYFLFHITENFLFNISFIYNYCYFFKYDMKNPHLFFEFVISFVFAFAFIIYSIMIFYITYSANFTTKEVSRKLSQFILTNNSRRNLP